MGCVGWRAPKATRWLDFHPGAQSTLERGGSERVEHRISHECATERALRSQSVRSRVHLFRDPEGVPGPVDGSYLFAERTGQRFSVHSSDLATPRSWE